MSCPRDSSKNSLIRSYRHMKACPNQVPAFLLDMTDKQEFCVTKQAWVEITYG
jgi:hypothetical protein